MASFYAGNTSESNWDSARTDFQSALGSGNGNLYQVKVYSRNTTGPAYGLFNATGSTTPTIELPYENSAGYKPFLGDSDGGFPKALYPNITYNDTGVPSKNFPSTNKFAAYAFPDVRLSQNEGLMLGPLVVNESFALVSLTIVSSLRENRSHSLFPALSSGLLGGDSGATEALLHPLSSGPDCFWVSC